MNHGHPVVGAFDEFGVLLGFATYGVFRVRPAYKYTVEHSVYVRPDKRGMGIGKVLLREIIKKAEKQNYHVMIGVIDASNTVSLKLHENEGFELTGIMKEVGYKFGKWLDAAFYQLILKTPENPIES
jgi:phosphinothricin acetyltransferase